MRNDLHHQVIDRRLRHEGPALGALKTLIDINPTNPNVQNTSNTTQDNIVFCLKGYHAWQTSKLGLNQVISMIKEMVTLTGNT